MKHINIEDLPITIEDYTPNDLNEQDITEYSDSVIQFTEYPDSVIQTIEISDFTEIPGYHEDMVLELGSEPDADPCIVYHPEYIGYIEGYPERVVLYSKYIISPSKKD